MKIELILKTLTPLWCGATDPRRMDRVREISLLGSLRWWYEAVVREMGWDACDPTHSICTVKKHCIACEVFGCQSLGAKFRLEINGDFIGEVSRGSPEIECRHQISASHSRRFRTFVPYGKTCGKFWLKIVPLRKMSQEEDELLKFTLRLMIEQAGFGARNQLGYGIVDYYQPGEASKLSIDALPRVNNGLPQPLFPKLQDFFFGEVSATSKQIVELVNIKCQLRNSFRVNPLFTLTDNRDITHFRHFILGTTKSLRLCPDCLSPIREGNDNKTFMCLGEQKTFPKDRLFDKMASKVFMSRPLPQTDGTYHMRIWGWVPSKLPFEILRQNVVNKINNILGIPNLKDLGNGNDYKTFLNELGISDV